jgi:hypothetical protein
MNRIRPNLATIFVALTILLAWSLPATAQNSTDWKSWPTGGRLDIGVGYFAPNLDTTVIVTDASGDSGTAISFEKNLGLDDNDGTGLLYVDWRLFKRHMLSYRYFELKRSATTTSSVSIAVGGEIFDINLPIQSFFDITANEIAYSYSLMFDQKKRLFVGLGISLQDLELGIQGTMSSPNPGAIIDSTLNSTAPLPTLNVGFNYAFSENWLFQSRLGWLGVEFDLDSDEELSGEIINANVGILWKAFNNVSFFAQYQVFDVNVDVDDNGKLFALDYDYKGPVLGVSVNF